MVRAKTLTDVISVQQMDGEGLALPPQVIKSAGRALQILELFDVLQRRSCVTEISTLLKYPQSSTSVLLRSLVDMGYLRYDMHSRTYMPSSRVALLGKWVSQDLVRDGSVTGLMRYVSEHTGQAVVLGSRQGLVARYNYVIQAQDTSSTFLVQGSVRSIFRSSIGMILMAGSSDAEIRRMVMRYNADGGHNGELISTYDVLARVDAVRSAGYAMGRCLDTDGFGMLAIALPPEIAPDAKGVTAIGIGADFALLEARKEEYLDILRTRRF